MHNIMHIVMSIAAQVFNFFDKSVWLSYYRDVLGQRFCFDIIARNYLEASQPHCVPLNTDTHDDNKSSYKKQSLDYTYIII